MILAAILAAGLLLQPSDTGTVLIDAVGCLDNPYGDHGTERGQDIIEKGHNALAEGNQGAAQLMFAGAVMAGTCRVFEAGERVSQFVTFNGSPMVAHMWVGSEMMRAVMVYPAAEPEPEALADYYWMLDKFIHFPED